MSKPWVAGEELPAADLNNAIKYGGDGSDGVLNVTSGTTTIDLLNAAIVILNYTTFNVSGGATLDFSNPHANGTIIIIKSLGAITITGTVDGDGMGASAGQVGIGTIVHTNGGVAGQGGINGCGTANGGAGGAVALLYPLNAAGKFIKSTPGSGGGNGGKGADPNAGVAGVAGTGGKGGACILFECIGSWNFTGTITYDGIAGGDGGDSTGNLAGGGGGGGGGAGGVCVAVYGSLTADSGTYSETGGDGGDGGEGTTGSGTTPTGGAGGGGGANRYIGGAGGNNAVDGVLGSGTSGGAAGLAATNTIPGGGGGGGASGDHYKELNTDFS